GLFETRVEGVDLGDGTFKVVSEPELLDEPFSPSEIGDAPAEPPEDATAPADLPEAGEFIDPNEVDVVETRPGLFEADLDGDGTNDVEFRGRVGDDGLIEVGRARPIGDDRPAEINEDNADEAGNTGTPEINKDNAPGLVDAAPDDADGEPTPLEPDAEDGGVKVIDIPGGEDAVDPGGPPNIFPADPKDEGQIPPPGGLDENEEIQPDKEPDPVDRLRPDGEAPPPEGEAPVEPPTGEVAPEPPAAEEQPPAGGVAPEPPGAGEQPPAGGVAPEPPGAGEQPPAGGVAPEPPGAGEQHPPDHEPPAGEHAPPGEVEVDLPELYEAPPEYASGSGGHAPPAGNGDPSTTVPVDDPSVDVPGVPAADCEPEPEDQADEPIDVNAADDGDDAGLLEQVADAVGDLWDDAKDVVT
ncbi:MAG TPA: hypothetical protein VMQ81_06010, partial [Acidimicrobiia bacterium]|nr:hypothetical protein [Acidimicrobiia bacterium]